MTIKEDKKLTLQLAYNDLEKYLLRGVLPALKAVAEGMQALLILTPKAPKRSDSGALWTCPNCMKFVDKYERSHGKLPIPHCKWCGQAFDWEVKT